MRCNHIAMLVRLTCAGMLLSCTNIALHGRTDNTGEALVTRDSLPVVAFPPFKRLGEVYSGLLCLSLEVELVYAALCDH